MQYTKKMTLKNYTQNNTMKEIATHSSFLMLFTHDMVIRAKFSAKQDCNDKSTIRAQKAVVVVEGRRDALLQLLRSSLLRRPWVKAIFSFFEAFSEAHSSLSSRQYSLTLATSFISRQSIKVISYQIKEQVLFSFLAFGFYRV